MSRHNRRRTRLPSKAFRNVERSNLSALASPLNHTIPRFSSSSGPASSGASSNLSGRRRRSTAFSSLDDSHPAHWQSRSLAWHAMVERECERHAQVLAKEQMRVFGGEEEGDEDGLCDKMMEFFGGLDFI